MGTGTLRMTIPTQLVLEVLLASPAHTAYGLEVGRTSGLPSGTVHPILARLEAIGWLTSSWEEVDPREMGRPARRYYTLTGDGAVAARAALARARRPVRLPGAVPIPEQHIG